MAININQTLLNLLAHNTRLTTSTNQSFERIASGERINSAVDDPTGLAISERFRHEIRGLRQNQENVSGAFSLIGIAETQLDGVIDLLQRARELAVQAGNDTLSPGNRQTLQGELDQLVQEIDRLAATTRFNDRNLLDGSFQGVRIQVGTQTGEFLTLSLNDHRSTMLGAQALVVSAQPVGVTPLAAGQVRINGVDVPLSIADGISTMNAAASALAKAAAINSVQSQTGVHTTALAADLAGVSGVQAVFIDGVTRTLKTNGVPIQPVTVGANDGSGALVTAINQQSGLTGVTASVDPAGVLTLTADDGRNIEVNTTGSVANSLGLSVLTGDVDLVQTGLIELSSPQGFTVEDPSTLIGMAASQSVLTDTSTAIDSLSFADAAFTEDALATIDTAIHQISDERSRLGAIHNRLEQLTDTLARQVEDLSETDSKIRDTDFALETARLVQDQILPEATLAMIAQANITPRRALELLRG